MNLATLKVSWIIVLNLLLLGLLLYQVFNIKLNGGKQGFINYPQQVDPTKMIPSNPDANEANQNYAQILNYISKNPSNSIKFIEDVRTKFFNPSCSVKSKISFNNLMNDNGPVF